MSETGQELIKSDQKPDPELKSNLPALPEKPQEAVLAIIQGVAQTPGIDTNVIEKLWVIHQEAQDRDAEQAYWSAMPKLQADLPLIPKRGVMRMTKGDASWNIPFAKFEDAIEILRPIMKKHGFSLTFKHKTLEGGTIHTTGIVAHKKGHKEEDEFDSMPDTSGSKNSIQAVGSARAYGKRYTTGSLLGLAFGGEDDDGAGTGERLPDQPEEKLWPDDAFDKNFPKWKELIESGDRSVGDILNLVASKGKLTEDQKKKIRETKPRNQQ